MDEIEADEAGARNKTVDDHSDHAGQNDSCNQFPHDLFEPKAPKPQT